MTYLDEWRKIVGRIRGVENACRLYLEFARETRDDPGSVRMVILDSVEAIVVDLATFQQQFVGLLPIQARVSISSFLEKLRPHQAESNASRKLQALAGRLVAFEGECSYLLSDQQTLIRRISERAFLHLQRSIVADTDIKQKWKEAFERGERACEKLGAAHLLLHGIWAFKADGERGETDLIFGEPLQTYGDQLHLADGLVLTEWKKATESSDVGRRFQEARQQAAQYARGVLGGTVLTGYRYLVVVSKDWHADPPDESHQGIVYKHVNLAWDPKTPSKTK